MTDSRGCEHEGTKVETASNRLNGVADPEGATEAGPDAIWIAHESKVVRRLNKIDFLEKVANGVINHRIIARHIPVSKEHKMPDKESIDKLLLITKYGSAAPYLDLAIGTKVSCTMNLGTQIGTL